MVRWTILAPHWSKESRPDPPRVPRIIRGPED